MQITIDTEKMVERVKSTLTDLRDMDQEVLRNRREKLVKQSQERLNEIYNKVLDRAGESTKAKVEQYRNRIESLLGGKTDSTQNADPS